MLIVCYIENTNANLLYFSIIVKRDRLIDSAHLRTQLYNIDYKRDPF